MAFSKAKLKRFNDNITYSPPPGTYNPKYPKKPLLGIFEKEERFKTDKSAKKDTKTVESEPKCTSHSEKIDKIHIDDDARKEEQSIESLGKRLIKLSTEKENDSLEESKSTEQDKLTATYSTIAEELTNETIEVDHLSKEISSEIEKNHIYINELETLIGTFHEDLKKYKGEREALEMLIKETKEEFEGLCLQNHKQNILYTADLKEKNLHLLEENEDLRRKILQLEKECQCKKK